MNTDIEQLLREGMERSTRGLSMPEGLARKAARRIQQRRHTARIVTAAGTATVMAGTAAVVAGVAGAPGSHISGPPLPGAPSSHVARPRLRTTAYVVRHVKRALTRAVAENGVSYTRTRYAAGFYEAPQPETAVIGTGPANPHSPWLIGTEIEWQYGERYRKTTFSPAGSPVFDYGLRNTRRATVTTAAIYHTRTWWRTPGPGPASQGIPNFGPHVAVVVGIVPKSYRWHPGPAWPVAILRDLATHRYRIVGHQRVDGVNALKLVSADSTADAPDMIWVNPATYLPVRTVDTLTLMPSHHQAWTEQADYQWLRPTPANIAQLNVRIPVGFTRVKAP